MPQSRTSGAHPSARTSRQAVLPPHLSVSAPGVGLAPRREIPGLENRECKQEQCSQRDLGSNSLFGCRPTGSRDYVQLPCQVVGVELRTRCQLRGIVELGAASVEKRAPVAIADDDPMIHLESCQNPGNQSLGRHERDRRAAILNAEGEKKSAILEAEGIRESQIKRAEGEREAAILEADGEAQARIRVAEAERNAIQLVQEGLSATGSNPAQYLVAVRYLESLKEMTSGKDNKVVYVPYEATGVLGSLGGIKDLLNGVTKG